jgi:2-keto-4-pentenoate hydratase/2-oxohepta-3-ene-1,7-dioic acid hydratase in catechol pathway
MGQERPGLEVAGDARDASHIFRDFDEAFFTADGIPELRSAYEKDGTTWPSVALSKVRLGCPIARPSKIVAVGLNYRLHADETGAKLPTEPKIFMKATTALCGVSDHLILPRGSEHTDYEVELACVIGRRAKYVPESEALSYVAGYTICNDYSERDYQKNRSGQFVKGKSADTFAPLGPYLVVDSPTDFSRTRLWCSVNGQMRQDDNTENLVFSVATLVASISQYMTLLPGDVISTGTPSGVGLGMQPPVFLRPGDIVEYGVDGIGCGRQEVVADHSGS